MTKLGAYTFQFLGAAFGFILPLILLGSMTKYIGKDVYYSYLNVGSRTAVMQMIFGVLMPICATAGVMIAARIYGRQGSEVKALVASVFAYFFLISVFFTTLWFPYSLQVKFIAIVLVSAVATVYGYNHRLSRKVTASGKRRGRRLR